MDGLSVVSDVHGRLTGFDAILARNRGRLENERLVMMGDMIGYGDSVGVARRVVQLVQEDRAIALAGNWELMLLLQAKGETPEERSGAYRTLVSRGGKPMLDAFWAERAFLCRWLDFIEAMPTWFYEDGFFLSHAGANPAVWRKGMTPKRFAERQTIQDLLWHFDLFTPESVRASETLPFRIVAGHVPIDTVRHVESGPLVAGRLIGVDFGAASRPGRLGLVSLPSLTADVIPI